MGHRRGQTAGFHLAGRQPTSVGRGLAFLQALICLAGCAGPGAAGEGVAGVQQPPARVRLLFHDPRTFTAPGDRCEDPLCRSLLERIDAARRSVDFAIYGFRGQSEILAALERARSRGLRVRGVVDRDARGGTYYRDTDLLQRRLISVRSDQEVDRSLARQAQPSADVDRCRRPEGFLGPLQCLAIDLGDRCLLASHASREKFQRGSAIMHNKFVVIDRRWVWTGSANLSDSGTGGYNANLVALVDSRRVASWYLEELDQMYHDNLYHRLKRRGRGADERRRVPLVDGEMELLFSPQDRPIETRLRPLIVAARARIDVAVFFLTHKGIARDLIDAQLRGVQVRVLIDATGAGNGYSKHALLRQAGIPVKVENWGGKMHMKSAVFDGETVVLGSMNWTSAGTEDNDENTLVLRSPSLARRYSQHFDALWAAVPERWLEGRPDPESRASGSACSDGSDNDFDGLRDGMDPGCSTAPPPLPPLPPSWLEAKGDREVCFHTRP